MSQLFGVDVSDCEQASGISRTNGYGRKKEQLAHRVAYSECYGEIPEGCEIHHLCGTRTCINPRHLQALTKYAHRQLHFKLHGPTGMAAVHAAKTTCKNGHPFDLVVGRVKQRSCSICHKERNLIYKSKPGVKDKINARRRELRRLKKEA